MSRGGAMRRGLPLRIAVLSVVLAGFVAMATLTAVPAQATSAERSAAVHAGDVPVMAYYYIWFNPTSWQRAKTDYPTLGRYSSDERRVMRQHIRWAKQSGIEGFIVSWKHTPDLDRRLERLIQIATQERFKLSIIYQGLDFIREPLPVKQVASDLDHFERKYAHHKPFRFLAKPLVIWSGTWRFSTEEIARVTTTRRDKLLILASERRTKDYEDIAKLVDGDAYYWSSVNPDTYPGYAAKLADMSKTVHESKGLWIAPAAPGFDARLIGGTTIVERDGGEMLRRQYNTAISSSPDVVGLISWNEFSENSHIEPSEAHGSHYLKVMADLRGAKPPQIQDFSSDEPGSTGLGHGIGILGVLLVIGVAGMLIVRSRRNAGMREIEQRN